MGMFDDLIPEKSAAAAAPAAASPGMFDDLIPAGGSRSGGRTIRDLIAGTPSREEELRTQYGKEISARGAPGYGERFIDAATMGTSRPLSGLVRGVGGILDPNSTFGERYRAGNAAAEDYFKKGEENTAGWGGVATDVAGAIAAPPVGKLYTGGVNLLKAGKAVVTGAPVVAQGGRELLSRIIAQGATTGAIEGAARNSKDVESAVEGAAVGAGLGAAGSAAVGGATKLIPGVAGKIKGAKQELREVNQGVPGEKMLENAKEGYQKLDNAGIAYGQPQTATLKAGLDDLKATNQYNSVAHSKISDYVDQLDKLAQNPAGAKFGELHNLRSAIAKEARGPDASTREAARKVTQEIDKLVQGNAPAINPNNVDIQNVYPHVTKLWRAGTLAQDVEYVAGKAERKAASKAGVNPDEANRAAFRPLQEAAEKPKKYSPFKGDDERALLAKIVQGDKLQNTYRNIGNAVPAARVAAGATAAALGLTHGVGLGVGGLGLGAAGGGAAQRLFERLAAGRGEQNIDALLRHITTGSSAPTNNMPSRQALAILQNKQAAQRAGAAYAGSKTGD